MTIQSKYPQMRGNLHEGISFHLDFQTQGALSLSHVIAALSTNPAGVTLSFKEPGGLLYPRYNADARSLEIFWRDHEKPVSKIEMPNKPPNARLALRQRDQIAFYVIPDKGDPAQFWLTRVDYIIRFRNAEQYKLCKDLKILMGEKRDLTFEELSRGVKLDCLDEIADITVTGFAPAGGSFTHRYKFDFETWDKKVDAAYSHLLNSFRQRPVVEKAVTGEK